MLGLDCFHVQDALLLIVALAAYAGAGISGGNALKTGVNASKLAIAAFIIPYIFALNPVMLLIDVTPTGLLLNVLTAIIGLFGVSSGLEGYVFDNEKIWQRILSIAGGLCLIVPGLMTDLIGVALVGLALATNYLMGRKKTAAAA